MQSKRVIWGAVIGNGLTTYDFTVYSFSAVIIGKLFFPSDSTFSSLLLSLLTFGAGFAMRPVGALIIGNLADSRGRKAGLTVSIALMTLSTGIIAFVPPYSSMGVLSTLLIILARLTQGFAAGGEIGVSSTVLMELAPRDRRCYMVSWHAASQAAAALLGALIGAATTMLTPAALHQWGWRIPFMVGMLIGPVGWYIRRHMAETPMKGRGKSSLKTMLARHRAALCFGILSMSAPTACIYLMVYYMPTYLVRSLHMQPAISLLSACLSSALLFAGTPLLARIADRQRQRKPTQYVTLISSIALVYPAFLLLTYGVGEILSLLIIGAYTALALCNNAATRVMLMEAFPLHHRATGMATIYSVGTVIFGSFCPLIVTWLIGVTGNPMVPAWYLLAALCTSLYALIRFPDAVAEH